MDRDRLRALVDGFVAESPLNAVDPAAAILPGLAGMRMYESPLLGVAAAVDPYFLELRRPGVIGPHFRQPGEWLPGAASVVSLFLPFTDPVVESNRADPCLPSPEWLHARYEGQRFIDALCAFLVGALTEAGHRAVAPSIHPDFRSWTEPADGGPAFTSNWSERHVAHVAGLGTFGLSAGIITERGMAGRLCSVITDIPLPADARPYSGHDDYCTRCGACIRRCRVSAITAGGKSKPVCSRNVNRMLRTYRPRYGCGKCQTAVPCERAIPGGRGEG